MMVELGGKDKYEVTDKVDRLSWVIILVKAFHMSDVIASPARLSGLFPPPAMAVAFGLSQF